MSSLVNIFKKIFKTSNQRKLSDIKPFINRINELEPEIKKLNQDDFKIKSRELKRRITHHHQTFETILPEAFALVREAAFRTLGQRHFDSQLVGGIVLHQGKIAEMKTGEGKTLVATLPAYLNALTNKGVHIVTVNDYLTKRDWKWMRPVYKYLGLSSGCILPTMSEDAKKKSYDAFITYGTNNEFGFDYLRDNMKYSSNQMLQRGKNFCIVDEVDSVLIDEARTPLIISGILEDNSQNYYLCNKIVNYLKKDHYEIDEKDKSVFLTEAGISLVEKKLKQSNFFKGFSLYDPANLSIVHNVNQALKANFLFLKNKDYIIKNNQILIIDEFTGRIMDGRRYADSLHQAIEAKEGVPIQNESQTFASITFQNYFRLYKKLSGMTGTAVSESEEFYDIYNLEVVEIPTNKVMIRKDLDDKIFRTEEEKLNSVLEETKSAQQNGQPVLIGTISIEKSEKISELLKKNFISHKVLNAKFHEEEAQIIAQAGRLNAVTIATNMAGRGTDIQLGGNLDIKISQQKLNNPEEINKIKADHEKEKTEVLKAGGLLVIGTERHESRRIDNQLRGRSGRQGDIGKSIFYVSLQDDLMRIFGSEKIDSILQKLGLKENESIHHPWISKALENAQKKIEARNFDIRKTLLQFDDVINDQRKIIFEERLKVINNPDIYSVVDNIHEDLIQFLLNEIQEFKEVITDEMKQSFKVRIEKLSGKKVEIKEIEEWIARDNNYKKSFIVNNFKLLRNERIINSNDNFNKDLEKKIFLQNFDFEWRSHLQKIEQLRKIIGLRGYGQKNPLDEFKLEAFDLFKNLLLNIKENLILFLTNIKLTNYNEIAKNL